MELNIAWYNNASGPGESHGIFTVKPLRNTQDYVDASWIAAYTTQLLVHYRPGQVLLRVGWGRQRFHWMFRVGKDAAADVLLTS